MPQQRQFSTFREAANAGPYDEYPMFPADVDPQICLSKNDRPQPFFLICQQDTVLVQMTGEGRIEFKEGPVRYWPIEPGDFVYIPGGTPHRYLPKSVSIQYRFKAQQPGLEGVAWYSEKSGRELYRVVWDTAVELPQEGYLRACREFNADRTRRTCPVTGEVHPEIDLSPYRWAAIAAELRAGPKEIAAAPPA